MVSPVDRGAVEPRWRHRASVAAVGDADRTVLLDLDEAAHPPRILLGPAAAVWQAVDGTRDVAGLSDHVGDSFGLAGAEVVDDVRGFVTSLAADGLVEQVDP